MKLRLNWSVLSILVALAVFWILLSKVLGVLFGVLLSAGAAYLMYRWFMAESPRG